MEAQQLEDAAQRRRRSQLDNLQRAAGEQAHVEGVADAIVFHQHRVLRQGGTDGLQADGTGGFEVGELLIFHPQIRQGFHQALLAVARRRAGVFPGAGP